jgi:hypothetical protein
MVTHQFAVFAEGGALSKVENCGGYHIMTVLVATLIACG